MLYLFIKLLKTSQPTLKFQYAVSLLTEYGANSRFIRRRFHRYIFYNFGSDISYRSKIDRTVEFIHPNGIIIGSQVEIHANCQIYQQTTFGSTRGKTGMPIIHEGCIIYAGAKIVGNIYVGENSIVGANAVITKDIPPNSIVVGNNRILRK